MNILLMKILYKVNSYFAKIEEILMDLSGVFLVSSTLYATLNRYFVKYSMSWYEELVVIAYSVLILWGASNVAKDNRHLTMDILLNMLKGKKKAIYLDLFIELACLVTSIIGVCFSINMILVIKIKTPALGIPNSIIIFFTLFMPFFGLTLTYLYKFVTSLNKLNRKSGKEVK